MAEESSPIEKEPEKRTSVGETIGGIFVVVLLWFWIRSCFLSNDSPRDVKPDVIV